MAFDPVTGISEAVTTVGSVINNVIDKIWPDPIKREQIKAEVAKAQAAGDLQQMAYSFQLALGQIDINKVEAASGKLFVAGWRPLAGWVCGAGFAWTYVLRPMLDWGLAAAGYVVPSLPVLDNEALMTLMLALLGMAGWRTADKIKGVAS